MTGPRFFNKHILVFLVLLCFGAQALAEGSSGITYSPFAVDIIPPSQVPSEEASIVGVRVSILYGRQRNIFGLDLGLLGNVTDDAFVGTAVSGLFNHTGKGAAVLGLQFAGLVNNNRGSAYVLGAQIAGLSNINAGSSSIVGLQFALLNYGPKTDIFGVQLGLINQAEMVVGLQLGLVNMAENLKGIQIGLINFNYRARPFRMMPLLNIGF